MEVQSMHHEEGATNLVAIAGSLGAGPQNDST